VVGRKKNQKGPSVTAAAESKFVNMVGVLLAVLAGLIVAAIIGGVKWLRVEDNREVARQRLCFPHRWVKIEDPDPSYNLIFVRTYDEQCSKCGKTR
jgi:hypothetical protein